MSINVVILLGNISFKAEMKTFSNGNSVLPFSVATNKTWLSNNEKKTKTEFHQVEVYGKLAGICEQYLKKGMQVYVEGELEHTTWEKNGVKQYKTAIRAMKVQFLDGKQDPAGSPPSSNQADSLDDDFNFNF
jgi:single-strand DNA-binding protein